MTNNVLLRNVTESDLPVLFEQQLDPEATAMAAFPSRDHDSFMAHWAKIMKNDSNILKAILFEGQVTGNVVGWEQDGKWEVGYWIGREFWGKGIATNALKEFLEIVKTRPLYAHVAKHNAASRRVLEKCGFTIIGRQWILDNDGSQLVEQFILKLDGNDG